MLTSSPSTPSCPRAKRPGKSACVRAVIDTHQGVYGHMHPRTRRRLEEALGVFRQVRTLGLKPDLITYSALISACEKVGDCDKAWVRQRMHALSLRTVPL